MRCVLVTPASEVCKRFVARTVEQPIVFGEECFGKFPLV